ncbi:MAG TPA: hypothetical protein VEK08_11335 [Planctomycetota bacterium]|nr:hypothetical protein [Planctomycetota bacterium]
MSLQIFIDTWAWGALASQDDNYHLAATRTHAELLSAGYQYVTSEQILIETITLLFSRLDPPSAVNFINRVIASEKDGLIRILPASRHTLDSAWELKKKFIDKPDISIVDFTTMHLMLENGISDIFTGYKHFTYVGLRFRLFPESP